MSFNSVFKSSIGLKVVMAVTGLGMVGFVIAHMLGNLQIFLGPDKINEYAAFLKSLGEILWVARLGLIAMIVLHVSSAISLSQRIKSARKKQYKAQATVQASAASRYMYHSGVILLIFIVVHLLHFTLGVVQPEYYDHIDAHNRHDVYRMIILGFQQPAFAVGYIIAMCCLAAHLSHAISSMFQTLGISHPVYTPMIRTGGKMLSVGIALGYIAIPLSVMLGLLA